MKNTLSGFSQTQINKSKEQNFNEKVDIKNSNVMDEYEKIKNFSQSEATSMLFNEVQKQKLNGSFDFQALSKQVESLQGYLSEIDYKNLKKMLESLR